MFTKPSDARRRDIGAELKRYREAAGLNGLQLAKKTGWDPSTISRLESGRYQFTETMVMVYLAHCGVSATDAAKVLLLAKETEEGYLVRREVLRTLILHETTATSIVTAAPLLVPGLLQTEEYARAVIKLHGVADDEAKVESLVSVRMERQELLKRWRPPSFTYMLYEGCLRCPFGGNRVMNEQMLHLAFLAGRSNITIRIVPTETGGLSALVGQLTLMDFADHGPVLHAETPIAGIFAERQDDIDECRGLLKRLGEVALSEEESRAALVQLASEYDRPHEGASNGAMAQE